MAAWTRSLVLFGFSSWLAGCGAGVGGSRSPGGPATNAAGSELALPGGEAPALFGTPTAPPPALSSADWRSSAPRTVGPFELLTDPGELPHLELARDARARLPLEHTRVSAKLSGFVAEVEVKQTYANPHDRWRRAKRFTPSSRRASAGAVAGSPASVPSRGPGRGWRCSRWRCSCGDQEGGAETA